jgi:hypothetical protein
MITGTRAFDGRSQSSVIGSILHVDPPSISMSQPMTPVALDRLVKTCLAKNPEKRWHTVHDVGLELQWIAEGGLQGGVSASVVTQRRSRERLAWGIAAIAALLVITLAIPAVRYYQHPVQTLTSRFEIQTSELTNPYQISISPDGRTLAYVAVRPDGRTALFLRPIDSVVAQPLPGTEGALLPFWSPDSQNVAYADPQNRKLKKIA